MRDRIETEHGRAPSRTADERPMVRRLTIDWPDARAVRRAWRRAHPLAGRVRRARSGPRARAQSGRPGRPSTRSSAAGDLEPDYLGFLGDAFGVPMAYVRGQPRPRRPLGRCVAAYGPAHRCRPAASIASTDCRWRPSSGPAYATATGYVTTARPGPTPCASSAAASLGADRRRGGPLVVLSHAPPRGVGDRAADPYHVGFAGYRWLLDRTHPVAWLHGHVPPASVEGWRVDHAGTPVVNVTGSILIEIVPPVGPATVDQNGGQGTAGQVGEG